MNCRHCKKELKHLFVDLNNAPPSNSYLSVDDLKRPEIFYPLRIFVCEKCWLVQTEDFSSSDKYFTEDYAYFSSTSSSWVKHAADYCEMIIDKLNLTDDSFVVEVASNDGYLLKNFLAKGIPCIGVEPTDSTADIAEKQGIDVIREFFGKNFAKKFFNKKADLIIGNNVFAHVPDINDFTQGLKYLLKDDGTVTLEFPQLLNLIQFNQFDTIYHEHFSYLSLNSVKNIFKTHGLRVWKVENLETHGGSLRVYGCHQESSIETEISVQNQLIKEEEEGLKDINSYKNFQSSCERIKLSFLEFLLKQKNENKKVIGYGAAAKGNTLLNYSGVKNDLIKFVVDKSPFKLGKYLPGSHIPILDEMEIKKYKPDYVLILPWNLKEEVEEQLQYIKEWGGKFVVFIPQINIF